MHNCDFIVDLDGQVTCDICGGRDDDMIIIYKEPIWIDPYKGINNQLNFE